MQDEILIGQTEMESIRESNVSSNVSIQPRYSRRHNLLRGSSLINLLRKIIKTTFIKIIKNLSQCRSIDLWKQISNLYYSNHRRTIIEIVIKKKN